jgi:hypothetical protein
MSKKLDMLNSLDQARRSTAENNAAPAIPQPDESSGAIVRPQLLYGNGDGKRNNFLIIGSWAAWMIIVVLNISLLVNINNHTSKTSRIIQRVNLIQKALEAVSQKTDNLANNVQTLNNTIEKNAVSVKDARDTALLAQKSAQTTATNALELKTRVTALNSDVKTLKQDINDLMFYQSKQKLSGY